MKQLYSGKVRDIYELDAKTLLLVASDRMSAFDVVMAEPIPDKGRVLTALTAFWCDVLADIAPTHLLGIVGEDLDQVPDVTSSLDLVGRAMIVRKAEMLPLECIVRGYLSGSAAKEYRAQGTMHGTPMPEGLRESERLPEPVFTPSTKAAAGHDENITFEAAESLVGADVAEAARDLCIKVYTQAASIAAAQGIIIADTKFELGWIDGRLTICDEILTPDSSRLWPAEHWRPGSAPPAFDKQPLRDWLESTGWDKKPPPPPLPPDVISASRARYIEAYERITGKRFADWYGVGE